MPNLVVIAAGLSGFAPENAAFEAGRIMLRRLDALAASGADSWALYDNSSRAKLIAKREFDGAEEIHDAEAWRMIEKQGTRAGARVQGRLQGWWNHGRAHRRSHRCTARGRPRRLASPQGPWLFDRNHARWQGRRGAARGNRGLTGPEVTALPVFASSL